MEEKSLKSSWEKSKKEIVENEINRICDYLKIADPIRKQSFDLLNKYLKKKKLHGKTVVEMCSVCVYYSCKLNNAAIPLKNFLDITTTKYKSEKAFFQSYQDLVLTIKSPSENTADNAKKSQNSILKSNKSLSLKKPSEYLNYFISELGLDSFVKEKAEAALQDISSVLGDYNPLILVTVIIYNICKKNNVKITMKEICDKARISQDAFNKTENNIIKYLK